MKKIMAKYNYAFGYVKGYFTLCGPVGIMAVIGGIVCLIQGEAAAEVISAMILPGLVIVLIAVAIVATTRKKCPEDKKGVVGLTFSMMIVGLGAAFALAWWMFKVILNLCFGWAGSGADNAKAEMEAERARQEAENRAMEARREAAKSAAMQQFGASASEVTVNSTGDRVRVGDDWHKVVEK